MKRRNFLKSMSVAGATLVIPFPTMSNEMRPNQSKSIRFHVCADVHKDLMHDADKRIGAFVNEAALNKSDFIIQMGDFCRPYDYNLGFMKIWNQFAGPRYHVIGNHDMDGGFTRQQVVEYWKSEGQYYSFDLNGFHFVVLDGNDVDPSPGKPAGYARYFGKEQLSWLAADLSKTDLQTIVFSHQGIDNDLGGITNGIETRLVLERANKQAGFQKVIAAFSGHHHADYHNNYNGIHYIQINSMSYSWLGEKYKHLRYSKEIDEQYPWVKYTLPYKDPIWAQVSISPDRIE